MEEAGPGVHDDADRLVESLSGLGCRGSGLVLRAVFQTVDGNLGVGGGIQPQDVARQLPPFLARVLKSIPRLLRCATTRSDSKKRATEV